MAKRARSARLRCGVITALTTYAFAIVSLHAAGVLMSVNTTADGSDASPGDGICDTTAGNNVCTLRAAIEESNAHAGSDSIRFGIPMSDPGYDPQTGVYTIPLASALPNITEAVNVTGPGADKLVIQRASTTGFRIFTVAAPGASVGFSGLTIRNGFDANGGGIANNYSTTSVTVTSCKLENNRTSVASNGGAIYNGGILILRNTTVHNNNAYYGGGIYNTNILTLESSTVSSNQAKITISPRTAGYGGGIYSTGTLNVLESTFSGNVGEEAGGAIRVESGTAKISSSTISGNAAGSGYTAGVGGGISGSGVQVKSTIIALNSAGTGPDVAGSFTSQGFNLVGKTDGSSGFTTATDLTGTVAAPRDPKLDPAGLQNNGGPTQTIALLFGSPAIDKGTSNGLTGGLVTDQRGSGFPRIFDDPNVPNAAGGDGADIGAFEVQSAAPTPTPTPTATVTPTATPSPSPTPTPTPTPGILGNISTRLRVETDDNVLIGGFIVTGSAQKKVVIRAIGPSLPISDALPDPLLELHDGTRATIFANDNWRTGGQEQQIIDTTIPPSNDLESAIVATLPANNSAYTAIVRGADGGKGVGLVEVYDLDRSVDSKLANISTRGFVQTGDNVMIGGFIVLGQNALKVLVRAIGPSTGVAGALSDPTLELRDKDANLLQANDNWKTDQQAEIEATTIPPGNELESALVRTVPAGNYTAIVRGANGAMGVALVEIFALN